MKPTSEPIKFGKFVVIALLVSYTIITLISTLKIGAENSDTPDSDTQSSATQNLLVVPSYPVFAPVKNIKFAGDIIEEKDISAIGIVGKYLLIGSDEGNTIQVLEPNLIETSFKVVENIQLPVPNADKEEIDIEGIAIADNLVYVVGSHSLSRKKIKPELAYSENVARLSKVKTEENRQTVFRFELNEKTGKLKSAVVKESLQAILKQNKILKKFTNIPSKENGVDIEGLAVKDKQLYFGFRGPVLRGNYTPVMVLKFNKIKQDKQHELRFINLGGSGIRELVAVDGGFLILAGAVGDKISPYLVYFWDGNDDLPGIKKEPQLKLLGEIPSEPEAKAEGLTVLSENDLNYEVLVVYDGVAKGNPTIFNIKK